MIYPSGVGTTEGMETPQILQGKEANPFTHAPEDWHAAGVPYGAFCKCSKCSYVGTSTLSFDYNAKEPGDALVCDQCSRLSTHKLEKILRPVAVKAFQEDHPNG